MAGEAVQGLRLLDVMIHGLFLVRGGARVAGEQQARRCLIGRYLRPAVSCCPDTVWASPHTGLASRSGTV